jgi:hypothetical protein
MRFSVAERGTALPPASPRPARILAPLTPSSCRWYRVTADGKWAAERSEDEGTTWFVSSLPAKAVVAEYLRSLAECREYIGSGDALADLERIQAEAEAEEKVKQ